MPIIRPAGNGRELMLAGWGLAPFWLKPEQLEQQPYAAINARSDRVQAAPTYREPFKKRRCLVPATGWKHGFESRREGHLRQSTL